MGVLVISFCNQSYFEFGHMMKIVILERCGTISALNGLIFASFNFVVMENYLAFHKNAFSPISALIFWTNCWLVSCQGLIISMHAKSTRRVKRKSN